jgi:hypothetical protein
MKCKWHGVNHHRTRDQASPGAIETLKVATFPKTYSGACECAQGKVSAERCSGFTIFDEDGKAVAHFRGEKYRMAQAEAGLVIYAMPDATGVRTEDPAPTQDADYRPCRSPRSHAELLASINQRSADFWAKRNAEG